MVFGTIKACENSLNAQMTGLGDNFLNPSFKDENDSKKQIVLMSELRSLRAEQQPKRTQLRPVFAFSRFC